MTIAPRTILAITAASVLLALASCTDTEDAGDKADFIHVNVQVTGATNLEPMLDELNRRDIKATLWLSGAELDEMCDYVGLLADQGHEIAGKYSGEIDADTSYEAQRAELEAMIEAAMRCTGKPISGFRATKFTSNEHTHRLLDEFEIPYMMRSNRQVLLSPYTYRPYRFTGYEFTIVPMPITTYFGRVCSLCDVSSAGDLGPDELLLHQKAAIDQNLKLGEPLVLEWHPEATYPNEPGGWWSNLTKALDYLESKGGAIRLVTCKQIAELYPPTGSRPVDVPPWEQPASSCGCE
jgi:hypothetical protein